MALVTDKPADLKPENALGGIADDMLGPHPARIIWSNRVLETMDTPPEPGEFVKFEITLRTRKDGRERLDDGTYVHFRIMDYVSAKLTVEPYKPEPVDDTPPPPPDDDPSLIDRDGNIPDDYDGDEGQAEAPSGLGEFDPAFSNGTPR